ncbi:MAG: helix-turn-helix domain-containing protein [Pseudomonadales bacterium]|nr:helix-turn-helix domain-containing protein [Pseudomonadales bacterium]
MTAQALLNPDDYEDARQARDPRFDGRFFVGVLTTGIYCRPVCPVRIPKKENVQLYKSAAAAAAAGFRPCLRCRPESSPGTPAWSGSSWKVSRALQLIDQGFLDSASVDELAAQLSVGSRQLSRLFNEHLGASPVEVAQTRRLHFAKKLIDETEMSLSDICFAAGFGSVRRFNAVFNSIYGRSPKQLREKQRSEKNSANEIELTLSYRPPYDWQSLLAFLAYRAIPGVEKVTTDSYARTFELDGVQGHVVARFNAEQNTINLAICYSETRHLYHIIDRLRSVFDLRADSTQIDSYLSKDKLLKPMVKKFPGLRVPGCWSGFEVAVRAILGQQVTVKAASTLVARIAARHGKPYDCAVEGLQYTFPEPTVLKDADLSGMGIVGQRIEAIKAVAKMLDSDELRIDCTVDTEEFVEKICSIKGIGEWTAQYIAMRAINDPNAFPHSDLILRRAATRHDETLTAKQLLERAEPWQPWRAYSVILLWRHYKEIKDKETKDSSAKKSPVKRVARTKE